MNIGPLAPILLAAVGAGGVAYVFLYPLLSGEKRAAKRQQMIAGKPGTARKVRDTGASRRDQVASSLKDLEERQKARTKVGLQTRIERAGLTWSRNKFFVVSGIAGAVLGVLLFAVTQNVLMLGAGLLVGGVGLPRWFLNFRQKRRIAGFLKELPNALDVVVRGIKSGLPLGDCVRIIAQEAAEPLRTEFRVLVEKQSVGISFAEAVSTLYERVPVPESNFFAIVIAIQSKSGGNLSEALGNLSKVLRERKKMKDKIVSMSQEAKASAGIIGVLPIAIVTITYITSPSYIELLWTTGTGKLALTGAVLWMSTGIFVMKKMVNFNF